MGVRRVAGATLRAGAVYLALCFSLTLGSALLARDCLIVEGNYDVAVVLGGGEDRAAHVLDARSGRIHAGVRLYERGQAGALLLSGDRPAPASTPEARSMADTARSLGVPDSALILETEARSTLQNAIFSLSRLPPDTSFLIVTEAFHALRSQASFAWAGHPAEVCAAPRPGRTQAQRAWIVAYETAAWGVNIPRAAIWFLASWLGLADRLPEAFLA